MKAYMLGALLCTVPTMLAGCTTISAGLVGGPPGVNRYSFRECLVDNGFLTDTVLVGSSKDMFIGRHAGAPARTLPDVERMSDAEFATSAAEILRRGMFPHQQYGKGAAGAAAGYVEALSDPVHNRPYVNNLEGGPYTSGASVYDVPSAGDPPRLDIPINRFLDCYLAPLGRDEPASTTGDYDLEGRLLRAHILLTMLASFGAELVTTHPSKRQATEAVQLLDHVRNAELALRSASPVMNVSLRQMLAAPPAKGHSAPATVAPAGMDAASEKTDTLFLEADRAGRMPILRWQAYTTRILRVFQVGVDIQVIDARQSLDRLTDIIGAFSTSTPAAFKIVLTDAVKGLATVQRVQLYGTAMRLDGVETLAGHREELRADPIDADAATLARWAYDIPRTKFRWGLWDAKLERACARLAGVANAIESSCMPTPDQLKSAFAAEMPPVPASMPTKPPK